MSEQAAWVIDVDERNFEQEVIERSRTVPVVVDLWAEWCGPCRMLGPLLEGLAKEKAGAFVLAKVNVDVAQELAAMFQVQSIPMVVAFRDGQAVSHFLGLLPEPQLREFIDKLVPSAADQEARQAADLAKQDPKQAEAEYRRVLKDDPKHLTALVGLARLLVEAGRDQEAEELLGRTDFFEDEAAEADRLRALLALRQLGRQFGDEAALRQRLQADPQNGQLRYELGTVLAAAGKYQDGLDHLLAAAETDRKLAAGPVREAMLKVFQVIGVRSDMADAYRDKLSKLLY